jgi:hypothetical protein
VDDLPGGGIEDTKLLFARQAVEHVEAGVVGRDPDGVAEGVATAFKLFG